MIRRLLKILTDKLRPGDKSEQVRGEDETPALTSPPPERAHARAPGQAGSASSEASGTRRKGRAGKEQTVSGANSDQQTGEEPSKPRRGRRGGRRNREPGETVGTEPQAVAESTPTEETDWDPASFQVEPQEGKSRFQDLNPPNSLMRAIAELDYRYCTPIQAQIIPHALEGRDATGQAQTGTGKTAAFLVAIITRLLREPETKARRAGTPRALILAPTRELVMQIDKEARELARHTGLRTLAVYGGMDYGKQQKQLAGRVDILAATPGRLLDFHRNRDAHLSRVEILVLDEADRMLDMGFIPDVRTIIQATPSKSQRQTLLFSATFDLDVAHLIQQWTRDPVQVTVEPEHVAAENVQQQVYIVTGEQKYALLYNLIHRDNLKRVIVFTNQRHEARRLADRLRRDKLRSALLSGEVPQVKRVRTLEDFRNGRIRVLVATDVAGRGIHVPEVSHVFNYNLPLDAEDYVHRIGRTGRAGAEGVSVSFACEEDSFQIPEIESYLGQSLHCVQPEESLLEEPDTPPPEPKSGPSGNRGSSNRSRGGSRRRGGKSGEDKPRAR